MPSTDFAFLADGRLFIVRPPAGPEPVESQFVLAAEDRRATAQERQGWRSQGMMWNLSDRAGMNLPDLQNAGADIRPMRFTGVAAAEKGAMYYALLNDAMGGLFHFDAAENYERRLAHRRNMELRDLARCPATGRLACSLRQPDGAANLGMMEADGGKLRDITTGDSVDEAPSWTTHRPGTIVFQSAGIARNESGAILGLGPYAIHELDLERDRMTTLLESDTFDGLLPRLSADGALYYIRRPYQFRPPVGAVRMLGDVVLFPYRVVRAMVHFMDAFSMMFSKKPLITAGGPRREGPDRRALMLWGRWVEIERERRSRRPNDDRPLVPRDWQLVRRTPDGSEATIAHNVLAFDLTADGSVLHTNGRGVYLRTADGTQARVASGHLIERVAALTT